MSQEKVIREFSGKRVLIAEDNLLNLEIATQMLLSMGVMVEQALDGEKAVEKVKASEPGFYNMVFLDIQMPVMNGYEAAAEIKKYAGEQNIKLPVAAMTANASDADREMARQHGLVGLIEKPLDIDAVHQILKDNL